GFTPGYAVSTPLLGKAAPASLSGATWREGLSVSPPKSPRIPDPTRSSVPRAGDRTQFPRGGYFVPPQATPQVHQPTRRGVGLVFPGAVPGHSAGNAPRPRRWGEGH